MSKPLAEDVTGRGASWRQARRDQRILDEALRWLRMPGVLLFLIALGLAAAG